MSTALTTMKSYQAELADRNGVVAIRNKYKYLSGEPFVYKFNGQNGFITDASDEPIMDPATNQRLKELTFQPIAYRFFNDNLFGRKEKDKVTPKFENWAEFFFVDHKNRVCVILFSGITFSELSKVVKDLFYDELYINEIVITMTPEQKVSNNDSSVKWWQGKFKIASANPALVKEYAEFERDNPVYQSGTITPSGRIDSYIGTYFEKLASGQVQSGADETDQPYEEPSQGQWSQPSQPQRGGFASSASEPLPF